MQVVVTRPAQQAGKWVSALRAAGLQVLSLPLIEIAPAPDPAPLHAAWADLAQWHSLMFVSANAVAHFFALRPSEGAQWPRQTRCWATGPGTVSALQHAGVPPHLIDAPDPQGAQFDSEALWAVVQGQLGPHSRALVVRGSSPEEGAEEPARPGGKDGPPDPGQGRDWLAGQLRASGVAVTLVVAYCRRAPRLDAAALAQLQRAASDGSVWLFSSSEAVHHLLAVAPGQHWAQARALATHPRIALAAQAAGFGVVATSRPAMVDLLASIESMA